jgi:hypothetical protein
MATELKSLFKDQRLALALKAALFAGFFGFAWTGGFAIVPVFVFIVGVSLLYFVFLLGSKKYLASFIIFIAVAITSGVSFRAVAPFPVLALINAFFFFILLGLKNLLFVHRARSHLLFFLANNYFFTLLVFPRGGASQFFLRAMFVFCAVFFSFHEYLIASQLHKEKNKIAKLGAAVAAMIAVETMWAASLLPLSSVSGAGMTFLATAAATDLIIRREQSGTIGTRAALINLTVLTLLVLLIFTATNWSI